MIIDVNETNCGGHFAIYTHIKLLCCTSETNKVVWQLYLNLKKKRPTQKIGTVTNHEEGATVHISILILVMWVTSPDDSWVSPKIGHPQPGRTKDKEGSVLHSPRKTQVFPILHLLSQEVGQEVGVGRSRDKRQRWTFQQQQRMKGAQRLPRPRGALESQWPRTRAGSCRCRQASHLKIVVSEWSQLP